MRHRYLLDNENLIFQKEEISFKQRVKGVLKFVYAGTGVALMIWALFYFGIIESPEKYFLQKINKNLVGEVKSIDSQFDHISGQLSSVEKRDDNFYRVISQINPLPASVRQAGFGGTDRYRYLDEYQNSDLLIESEKKGDILLKQLYIQSKSYDTVIYIARSKQDSLLCVPGIMPLSPKDFVRISDPFGLRIHPIKGKLIFHEGIDLASRAGNEIHATGNGKVVAVKRSIGGYGNHIVISHGFGFKSLYAHMTKIYVKEGETVKRGEVIGTVGSTGSSTGPHLHYEVMYNNIKRNPKYYYINDLTDHEFKQMVQLLTVNN